MATLTLDELVTLSQDVEPCVMDWPSSGVSGLQARRWISCSCPHRFCARRSIGHWKRSGSPWTCGAIYSVGCSRSDVRAYGPFCRDLGEGVLGQMHAPDPAENYPFSYDADQPFAFPSPQASSGTSLRSLEAAGCLRSLEVAGCLQLL